MNHISGIIKKNLVQIQEFEGLYDIIKQKTLTMNQKQLKRELSIQSLVPQMTSEAARNSRSRQRVPPWPQPTYQMFPIEPVSKIGMRVSNTFAQAKEINEYTIQVTRNVKFDEIDYL